MPQAAAAAAAALYVTDKAGMQPIGHRLSPEHMGPCSKIATRIPGLPFHSLHLRMHVIKWITTHLLTPKPWKAELAWLADL